VQHPDKSRFLAGKWRNNRGRKLLRASNDSVAADSISFEVRKGKVPSLLGFACASDSTILQMLSTLVGYAKGTATVSCSDEYRK
jgi:ABC-type Na+ transport system ATPase subunit NatA